MLHIINKIGSVHSCAFDGWQKLNFVLYFVFLFYYVSLPDHSVTRPPMCQRSSFTEMNVGAAFAMLLFDRQRPKGHKSARMVQLVGFCDDYLNVP